MDQQQATLAHIEQVRMLIMGMEQRLQTREDKVVKSVERAESEGRRFEELRREIANNSRNISHIFSVISFTYSLYMGRLHSSVTRIFNLIQLYDLGHSEQLERPQVHNSHYLYLHRNSHRCTRTLEIKSLSL
jgi:hypothetical protein